MNMFLNRRRTLLCLALATGLAAAQAETWPQAKAITLVVGYPAGGSADLVARIILKKAVDRS